jgi:hypothetical protein
LLIAFFANTHQHPFSSCFFACSSKQLDTMEAMEDVHGDDQQAQEAMGPALVDMLVVRVACALRGCLGGVLRAARCALLCAFCDGQTIECMLCV